MLFNGVLCEDSDTTDFNKRPCGASSRTSSGAASGASSGASSVASTGYSNKNRLRSAMQVLSNKDETVRVQDNSLRVAEARIAALTDRNEKLQTQLRITAQELKRMRIRQAAEQKMRAEQVEAGVQSREEEIADQKKIVNTLQSNLSVIEELYRECFYEIAKQEDMIESLRQSCLDVRLMEREKSAQIDRLRAVVDTQKWSLERCQDIAAEVEGLKSEIMSFLNNTNNDSGMWEECSQEGSSREVADDLQQITTLLLQLQETLLSDCECGLREENKHLKETMASLQVKQCEPLQKPRNLESTNMSCPKNCGGSRDQNDSRLEASESEKENEELGAKTQIHAIERISTNSEKSVRGQDGRRDRSDSRRGSACSPEAKLEKCEKLLEEMRREHSLQENSIKLLKQRLQHATEITKKCQRENANLKEMCERMGELENTILEKDREMEECSRVCHKQISEQVDTLRNIIEEKNRELEEYKKKVEDQRDQDETCGAEQHRLLNKICELEKIIAEKDKVYSEQQSKAESCSPENVMLMERIRELENIIAQNENADSEEPTAIQQKSESCSPENVMLMEKIRQLENTIALKDKAYSDQQSVMKQKGETCGAEYERLLNKICELENIIAQKDKAPSEQQSATPLKGEEPCNCLEGKIRELEEKLAEKDRELSQCQEQLSTRNRNSSLTGILKKPSCSSQNDSLMEKVRELENVIALKDKLQSEQLAAMQLKSEISQSDDATQYDECCDCREDRIRQLEEELFEKDRQMLQYQQQLSPKQKKKISDTGSQKGRLSNASSVGSKGCRCDLESLQERIRLLEDKLAARDISEIHSLHEKQENKLLNKHSSTKVTKKQSSTKVNKKQSSTKINKKQSPTKVNKKQSPTKVDKKQSSTKVNKKQSPTKVNKKQSSTKVMKKQSSTKETKKPSSTKGMKQSHSGQSVSNTSKDTCEYICDSEKCLMVYGSATPSKTNINSDKSPKEKNKGSKKHANEKKKPKTKIRDKRNSMKNRNRNRFFSFEKKRSDAEEDAEDQQPVDCQFLEKDYSYQREVEAYENRIRELEDIIAKKDDIIAEKEDIIAKKDQELDELKLRMSAATDSASQLNEFHSSLANKNNDPSQAAQRGTCRCRAESPSSKNNKTHELIANNDQDLNKSKLRMSAAAGSASHLKKSDSSLAHKTNDPQHAAQRGTCNCRVESPSSKNNKTHELIANNDQDLNKSKLRMSAAAGSASQLKKSDSSLAHKTTDPQHAAQRGTCNCTAESPFSKNYNIHELIVNHDQELNESKLRMSTAAGSASQYKKSHSSLALKTNDPQHAPQRKICDCRAKSPSSINNKIHEPNANKDQELIESKLRMSAAASSTSQLHKSHSLLAHKTNDPQQAVRREPCKICRSKSPSLKDNKVHELEETIDKEDAQLRDYEEQSQLAIKQSSPDLSKIHELFANKEQDSNESKLSLSAAAGSASQFKKSHSSLAHKTNDPQDAARWEPCKTCRAESSTLKDNKVYELEETIDKEDAQLKDYEQQSQLAIKQSSPDLSHMALRCRCDLTSLQKDDACQCEDEAYGDRIREQENIIAQKDQELNELKLKINAAPGSASKLKKSHSSLSHKGVECKCKEESMNDNYLHKISTLKDRIRELEETIVEKDRQLNEYREQPSAKYDQDIDSTEDLKTNIRRLEEIIAEKDRQLNDQKAQSNQPSVNSKVAKCKCATEFSKNEYGRSELAILKDDIFREPEASISKRKKCKCDSQSTKKSELKIWEEGPDEKLNQKYQSNDTEPPKHNACQCKQSTVKDNKIRELEEIIIQKNHLLDECREQLDQKHTKEIKDNEDYGSGPVAILSRYMPSLSISSAKCKCRWELTQLQGRVRSLEACIAEKERLLNECWEHMAYREKEVTSLQLSTQTDLGADNQLESNILKQTICDCITQIEDLNNKVNQFKDENRNLQTKVCECTGHNQVLKDQVQDLEVQKSERERRINELLEKKDDQFQCKCKEVDMEVTQLRDRVRELEEAMAEKEKQLQKTVTTLEGESKTCRRYDNECGTLLIMLEKTDKLLEEKVSELVKEQEKSRTQESTIAYLKDSLERANETMRKCSGIQKATTGENQQCERDTQTRGSSAGAGAGAGAARVSEQLRMSQIAYANLEKAYKTSVALASRLEGEVAAAAAAGAALCGESRRVLRAVRRWTTRARDIHREQLETIEEQENMINSLQQRLEDFEALQSRDRRDGRDDCNESCMNTTNTGNSRERTVTLESPEHLFHSLQMRLEETAKLYSPKLQHKRLRNRRILPEVASSLILNAGEGQSDEQKQESEMASCSCAPVPPKRKNKTRGVTLRRRALPHVIHGGYIGHGSHSSYGGCSSRDVLRTRLLSDDADSINRVYSPTDALLSRVERLQDAFHSGRRRWSRPPHSTRPR